MDENREGRTSRIGTFQERRGIVEQVSDAAQDAYGQAADTTRKVADAAQDAYGQAADAAGAAYGQAADATRNFDQWLRNAIETQPYTSALVALGIGWLLGRMHRPL